MRSITCIDCIHGAEGFHDLGLLSALRLLIRTLSVFAVSVGAGPAGVAACRRRWENCNLKDEAGRSASDRGAV